MNPQDLQKEIADEVSTMTDEQKKEFFTAMMERFQFRKGTIDERNRAKRRRPMNIVRKERRARNRAASQTRAKNRK